MNCEICQELLVSYLLGELENTSVSGVEDHLRSGCAQCNEEKQSLVGAIDLLFMEAEDPRMVDDDTREQIWQAIETKLMSPVSPTNRSSVGSPMSEGKSEVSEQAAGRHWSASWAAAALAVACGFVVASVSSRFVSTETNQINVDKPVVAAQRATSQDSVRTISLRPSKGSTEQSGTLIYDFVTRQIHFYTDSLAPPGPGQSYRLWFITDQQHWIFAGRLEVEDGVVTQIFDLPDSDQQVAYTAVTLDSDTASQRAPGAVALVSDDVPSFRAGALE